MQRGFTLIELLIVVAIIAILAAIAVPNFLEAQTRSKISRNKADMRSMATALEAYVVDNNKYPPDQNTGTTVYMSYLKRLLPLTTPVAYITSVPDDVFNQFGENTPAVEWKTFDYFQKEHLSLLEQKEANDVGGKPIPAKWLMRGWGPDKDNDRGSGLFGAGPIPYDPTNGTISNGDMKYWGPGGNFNQ